MSLANLKFKPGTYLAFVLSDESRSKLLGLKPPQFGRVLCHHVTIQFAVTEKQLETFQAQYSKADPEVEVFGYSKFEHLECFSIRLGGATVRPGGGFFHITHSLKAPAKPVDSNHLLKTIHGIPQEKLKPIRLTGNYELVK